jgi:hypothetical protein
MTEFKAYIILDGLFLVDFDASSFRIIIPATHGHAHQIATDATVTVAGRKDIPASHDYKVVGLTPPAAAAPFTPGFDLKHLVFDESRLAVKVPTAGPNTNLNPHAIISVPFLPDAIFGFKRFETSKARILNQTDPGVLKGGPRERIVFTERVVLAFEKAGDVALWSSVQGGTHDAVSVNQKRVLTFVSKPNGPHPGNHGGALNELLVMPKGGNANLGLTGIPFPHPDVRRLPDDLTPDQLGLPVGTVGFASTIEGSGCGFVGTRK